MFRKKWHARRGKFPKAPEMPNPLQELILRCERLTFRVRVSARVRVNSTADRANVTKVRVNVSKVRVNAIFIVRVNPFECKSEF